MKTAIFLMATVLLATAAHAQERTASGAMDAQISWSTLNTKITNANTKADAVNTRVDQVVICSKKGMLYAPGQPTQPGQPAPDSQGCVVSQLDQTHINTLSSLKSTVTNINSNINSIRSCGASGQTFNGSTCVSTSTRPNCTLRVTTYNSCGDSGGRRRPNLPAGAVTISSTPNYCGSQQDTSGPIYTYGWVECN